MGRILLVYDGCMENTAQPHPGRIVALVMVVLGPLVWLMVGHGSPILQDRGYHVFADARTCLGMANFGNVASNALFLIFGAVGARHCWRRRPGAWRSWLTFFSGVTLVFFGSAYYHGAPGDDTLVWDRLPMTVAFMGLFAALASEHLHPKRESALLAVSVLIGLFSVFWWQHSGDLRIYIWVQGAPLLAIPYLIAAFPGRHTHRHYLLYGIGFYALAKAAESLDHPIYAATGGMVSGHTLKHVLAAIAVLWVHLMLCRRSHSLTPVASSQ